MVHFIMSLWGACVTTNNDDSTRLSLNLWSIHALLAGMLICPVTTEIGVKVPQKNYK